MLLENGKQDKRTFRKKKRRKSIRYTFRCTHALLSSFFPSSRLEGVVFRKTPLYGSIALTRTSRTQRTFGYLCRNFVASSSSKVFDRWILEPRTGNYASAYRPRRKWRHGATPITPLSAVLLIAFSFVRRENFRRVCFSHGQPSSKDWWQFP